MRKGPGRAAELRRLSTQALGAFSHNAPREHVRDCAASNRQNQGLPVTQEGADDGLQAEPSGKPEMAAPRLREPDRRPH